MAVQATPTKVGARTQHVKATHFSKYFRTVSNATHSLATLQKLLISPPDFISPKDTKVRLPIEQRGAGDTAPALGRDEQDCPQVGDVPGDSHRDAHRRVHLGAWKKRGGCSFNVFNATCNG